MNNFLYYDSKSTFIRFLSYEFSCVQNACKYACDESRAVELTHVRRHGHECVRDGTVLMNHI
jgi:hypothetical protein